MRIMRINGWLYERDARTSQEGAGRSPLAKRGRDARTSQEGSGRSH